MIEKFSSECVTIGHPDKVCDTIADSILDAALKQDSNSHMAVECTIKDDFVLIYGEANTKANLDYKQIALDTLKMIGYNDDFNVVVKVGQQSSQIDNAVAHDGISAGDQGIMFGYACNETDNYMPYGYELACKLAYQLQVLRQTKYPTILHPDGKTQVTVSYKDGVLDSIDTIVISCCHSDTITLDQLKSLIQQEIILPLSLSSKYYTKDTKVLINPSGAFTIGGPYGDSGTTGRKIVVDSYGGYAPIGGGCFSSKDPSKVDRSAACYARYVAKNLVANNLCAKVCIQVAYAIGVSKPVSLNINCYGTNKVSIEDIYNIVNNNFDFSVSKMLEQLNLRQPIYSKYCNYGTFNHKDAPWETVIKL